MCALAGTRKKGERNMNGKEITLAEVAASPEPWVTPTVAAKLLGKKSGYGFNLAAKEGRLGIPHMWSGRNLLISKAYLLDFLGWKP